MNLRPLLYVLSALQLCSVGWASSALFKDGDHCTANAQCQNVCSRYGSCYTPKPGTVAVDEPCTSPSQCKSGWCELGYGQSRPSFGGPDDNTYYGAVLSDDTTCKVSYIGQPCNVTRQCYWGRCDDHVCSQLPLNSACDDDFDCHSNQCINGICVIQGANRYCYTDRDCFSKTCVTMECARNDYTCYPPNLRCAAVQTGATCRYTEDCDAGDGYAVCDKTDHKCRQTLDQECKTDKDCFSKHCTDGRCSTKGSVRTTTMKTTKTATTKTATTKTATTKTATTKTTPKTTQSISKMTTTTKKATSTSSTSKHSASTSKSKPPCART